METNFSLHAFERVLGRISLTHGELADILNADLAINIGQENNSNRVHKLFYSDADKMCFVAIQDINTGTVVTVLPIDYHENISWVISIASQKQAKKLITKGEFASNTIDIVNTDAAVFRISGSVVDDYGRYVRTICLGSWPCLPYEYSIADLVEDRRFLHHLEEKIEEKMSRLHDDVRFGEMLVIRVGASGEPVVISASEVLAKDS